MQQMTVELLKLCVLYRALNTPKVLKVILICSEVPWKINTDSIISLCVDSV